MQVVKGRSDGEVLEGVPVAVARKDTAPLREPRLYCASRYYAGTPSADHERCGTGDAPYAKPLTLSKGPLFIVHKDCQRR